MLKSFIDESLERCADTLTLTLKRQVQNEVQTAQAFLDRALDSRTYSRGGPTSEENEGWMKHDETCLQPSLSIQYTPGLSYYTPSGRGIRHLRHFLCPAPLRYLGSRG